MYLDKIVKCDTEKPYVFVSYSSKDADVVWADVYEFQKRGYNVWLDEKNLDKTKESWKDDAIEAIKDMDCQLVLFYVSRNSLTSEPCLNEMRTTRTGALKYHKGKPVPFIAVDVENIGNIVDFQNVIFDEIMQTETLDKAQKKSKIGTMNEFIEEFFNSNNERVRIHARTNESSALRYYDEITKYFYSDTPVSVPKPVVTEPEKATKVEVTSSSDMRVIASSAELKKLFESDECQDSNLKKALKENNLLVRISSSDISYREEYLKYDTWLFSLDKSKENAKEWEFYILKKGDVNADTRICFDATDLNVSVEIKNSIRKPHLAGVKKVTLDELLSGKWTNCF